MSASGTGEGIVVIGVSGSGKSTVGKLLAPRLEATFLEGDAYHPSANVTKMRAGQALTDADRWPWLDTLGHAIAEHAATGRNVVAACSALRRAYRERLSEAARMELAFVHLTIDPKVLAARMRARRQHFMPVSLLESQLATLEPLAPDERGVEIPETGTALQATEAIHRWLVHRPHAGDRGTIRKGRPLGRPS